MVSTVISKIISMQPNFTVSENAISQYVIGHAEQILTTTITALADETGTSEASINRFCKKLGYKGFNGLKIALAQESFYNNMVQEYINAGYSQEDALVEAAKSVAPPSPPTTGAC